MIRFGGTVVLIAFPNAVTPWQDPAQCAPEAARPTGPGCALLTFLPSVGWAILMRRRDFITFLGGAAAGWPLAARAQKSVPRLGVLLYTNPELDPNIEAVRLGLRALGYTEGKNLAIEYRYAEGRPERLARLAAELAQTKPDVILALGGEVAPWAKKATESIPLVFAVSTDPVLAGLVVTLGRPGGNATGVTFILDELASKRLELLKEAAPRISRVAFLWNPDHPDNEYGITEQAARKIGVELRPVEMRGPDDLQDALHTVIQVHADALYVVSSRHTITHIPSIVGFAAKNQLPLASGFGAWAKAGGLLSYGPNVDDMVRRTASYVDRILKGAKPADLPVQQPARFALVINITAARALGLTIPESFLLRADEVIE
jgi:putative ABC transport system substrate-binding protein